MVRYDGMLLEEAFALWFRLMTIVYPTYPGVAPSIERSLREECSITWFDRNNPSNYRREEKKDFQYLLSEHHRKLLGSPNSLPTRIST